jgi:tRNA/tmRNA/rRNA uracil-C5-methylase (TrmA/RlmC/RlmD family)
VSQRPKVIKRDVDAETPAPAPDADADAEATETKEEPKKQKREKKESQGPLNKPNGSSVDAAIEQLASKPRLSRQERKLLNQLREGKAPYERPMIGMFASGTHDIAPGIEQCPAHHHAVNHALAVVQAAVYRTETVGYNDSTGAGNLRYVSMSVVTQPEDQNDLNKVQLTIVWNATGADADKPASFDTPAIEKKLPDGAEGLAVIAKEHPALHKLLLELRKDPHPNKRKGGFHSLWHSIHVNYNNAWSHTNTIFSFDPKSWQHVYGPVATREVLPVRALPVAVDDDYNSGRLGWGAATGAISTEGSGANKKMKFDFGDDEEAKPAAKEEPKAKPAAAPKAVLAKPTLTFPPTVFRQANLEGFTRIISALRRYIPSGARVVELYGGVGTIGLNLLDRVEYLVCSDENPNNEKAFYNALETVPGPVRDGKAAKYVPKNANDMVGAGALANALVQNTDVYKYVAPAPGSKKADLRHVKKEVLKPAALLPPDVCLVDPPRKGLDEDVLAALAMPKLRLPKAGTRIQPATNGTYLNRLVYVSCGFRALMRDCERLTSPAGGGWRIQHAEGHVLFPGADHLETLVVFVR